MPILPGGSLPPTHERVYCLIENNREAGGRGRGREGDTAKIIECSRNLLDLEAMSHMAVKAL